VGRLNGSKATLIKATPEEAAGFVGGQLAQGFLLNRLQTYFKRLRIGSESIDFNFNPLSRTVSVADPTGNLLDSTLITPYYMTFGGIGFTRPLLAGNLALTGISNINYNPSNQTINCTVNNTAATISNVVVPLKVDVNAPRRWWDFKAATDDYWFSIYGFHANGVENAYRIDTLTAASLSYYFLIYYPKYDTRNDLFAPIFLNATQDSLKLVYGSAPAPPAYTSDGRAIFTQLGVYGTYPTVGPAANTAMLLYNPRGFYFVQTTRDSYDMVNASDSKSWISWQ
jgi:hypothetical protein